MNMDTVFTLFLSGGQADTKAVQFCQMGSRAGPTKFTTCQYNWARWAAGACPTEFMACQYNWARVAARPVRYEVPSIKNANLSIKYE